MRQVRLTIYWLLYKIVQLEPTLNFGWLKQNTVAVSDCSSMSCGDVIMLAGKTLVVIGTSHKRTGSTMTFMEGDR